MLLPVILALLLAALPGHISALHGLVHTRHGHNQQNKQQQQDFQQQSLRLAQVQQPAQRLQGQASRRCILLEAPDHGFGSFMLNMLQVMALLNPSHLPVYLDYSRSPFQCLAALSAAAEQPSAAIAAAAATTNGDNMQREGASSTGSMRSASQGYSSLLAGPAPLLPGSQPGWAGCEQHLTFGQAVGRLAAERLQRADELGVSYGQMEFGQGLSPEQQAQRSRVMRPYLSRICQAASSVWVLAPELQAVASYELQQLALLPAPLVALHIRGGDKLANGTAEVPRAYAYDFEAGVRRLLATHPGAEGGTCVLLGDDASLLPRVAAAARAVLRCAVVVSRLEPGYAHHQAAFNAQPQQRRCARTQKYLVDLEILARSDFSLGTVHSNVDLLAFHLKRCIAGKPGSTYVDLGGVAFEGYSPKLNANIIPPELRELYPEALAGHVDTGSQAVTVAGRSSSLMHGAHGGGSGGGGSRGGHASVDTAAAVGTAGGDWGDSEVATTGLLEARLPSHKGSDTAAGAGAGAGAAARLGLMALFRSWLGWPADTVIHLARRKV